MKTLVTKRLTPENVEMFGKAIKVDDTLTLNAGEHKYVGQLTILSCEDSLQVGIHSAGNQGFVVSQLEQHADTPELLAALKGDFIVPVTNSIEVEGKQVPDMANISAIRVNQGEGIVFEKGVWHWSPYPAGDYCDVLVIFKKDTPDNDFISFKLEEEIRIIP